MRPTAMKKLLITLGAVVLVLVVGMLALGNGAGSQSDARTSAGQAAKATRPQRLSTATGRDAAPDNSAEQTASGPDTDAFAASVIRVGNLSLRSRNLPRDLVTIKSLVRTLGGHISNENSSGTGDRSRNSQYAELTVRVPEARFEQAMRQIGETAKVTGREISAEDVTTQVIDVEARVKSKRASVASLETLLARAKTVGEVMAVERELSARQADLDSLVQQQKYLATQTSMSTINVSLSSRDRDAGPDTDGFRGGLATGWAALTGFLVGVSTVAGVLLPWLPLIALVAVPAWWWLRRRTTRKRTDPGDN